LYTDGITEAQNAADELFGEARLETAVAAHAANHAHHIQQALLDAVAAFTAGAPQFDDIACLTLKRLPPTP
ncbi:MAG: SpoIIE family protein phosphatase, partial [Anaerolineales bacterium]|nr:SpoIIE family protein phosphatase [Anaerolineales bacterium]